MTTAELAKQTDRRCYIGGSDTAAVLGLSRYKTPLQLWAEKTGNIVPEDRSASLPVRLGHRLEDVVAELFTEETGNKVRRVTESQVHSQYDFLRAQIDRRIVGHDEILECKTASGWKSGEWADEDIPQEYILQCLHQLAVTGRERCHIACLIGGNQEFVHKIIERDESLISEIVKKEVQFWEEFVVPRQMPAVSSNDASTLFSLFPKGDEESVVDLSTYEGTIERIKFLDNELDNLEAEKEQHKNGLRALLKEATVGTAGKWKVTWKNQSMGLRLDTEKIKIEAPELYAKYGKTGESRVLRIAELKSKKGGK